MPSAMSQNSPAPSITQASGYRDHRRSPQSSYPTYHYPPVPPLQQPRPAYQHPHRISPIDTTGGGRPHGKNSISSAGSASTAGSDYKPISLSKPYRFDSQAERGLMDNSSPRHSQYGSHARYPTAGSSYAGTEMVEDNSAVLQYVQRREIIEDEEGENDHAVWILIWLSFLDPLHCIFSAIFSIITLIVLLIFSPVRLCQSKSCLSTSLIRTIAPVFRNHLQMMYAPSVEKAHTFNFSATRLILVHVASPILSLGIVMASWIAAVFWLFAITMGNPDGTERRDDGKATVLMVRNWWEKYLLSAIRQ